MTFQFFKDRCTRSFKFSSTVKTKMQFITSSFDSYQDHEIIDLTFLKLLENKCTKLVNSVFIRDVDWLGMLLFARSHIHSFIY